MSRRQQAGVEEIPSTCLRKNPHFFLMLSRTMKQFRETRAQEISNTALICLFSMDQVEPAVPIVTCERQLLLAESKAMAGPRDSHHVDW